ncbi:MAG TPA: Ig-like domain-containing protein [Candidatus Tidjanibacter gallistercoris]|nr:Ig-like domain-containing protein [Candidatus Tidjanibacter gallistercoris]
MKKSCIFIAAACTALAAAGCSQKDRQPSIDREHVQLYAGETVRLTADRPVAWSAADDFYAAVDGEGNVTARHVGTTTVTAANDSGSAACTVTVQPRYDTFIEPAYELIGQQVSHAEIDAIEQREKIEETKFSIAYKGEQPYIQRVEYFYNITDENELNAITVRFDKGYEIEVKNFLSERYLAVPISTYTIDFYNHYETLATVKIAWSNREQEVILQYGHNSKQIKQ